MNATWAHEAQLVSLQNQVATLSSQLAAAEQRRKEVEKEQEDLLVLLDEVSVKRKDYKARLRRAGEEVSEDDDEDEEGEE